MFATLIQKLGVKGLVAGSVVSLMPTAAFAHHGFLHLDLPLPGPSVTVETAAPAGRVWVEPVVQTVNQQQWIEPVYQNVEEQVWVPDTATTQNMQVYVPAQYGFQNVVQYDGRGYPHTYRQQVLLSAAHYENQPQTVVVPAHNETRTRQVMVTPGHFEVVPVTQVVVPGHWQPVGGPAVIEHRVSPGVRVNLRLPF